jgi:hypothetical protein
VAPVLLAAWIAFLADVVLAPSSLPSTLDMATRLTVFDWPEPSLVALWYATGSVIFLHTTYYASERPQAKPHPLLVLPLAIVFGSAAMLPYYAWRRPDPAREPWRLPWRALRTVLVLELVAALAYGLARGDLSALWTEVTQRRFSHVLAVDFAMLSVLLIARRRIVR